MSPHGTGIAFARIEAFNKALTDKSGRPTRGVESGDGSFRGLGWRLGLSSLPSLKLRQVGVLFRPTSHAPCPSSRVLSRADSYLASTWALFRHCWLTTKQKNRDSLRKLLELYCPDVQVVGEADSVEGA